MNHEAPVDADAISDEEFTELLTVTEGTTPEKIDRGASEHYIALPEETTIVDVDE